MIYRKPSNAMWIDAVRLLEQADNLHRQFFRPGHGGPQGPTWEPPIDIFETGRALSVLVALPGVAPDQVQVLIDGPTLTVVGERPLPAPAEAHIRRIEIPYGRFERRIALPPGAFEIREHRMVDGCLLLTLLKLG
ncbi:Hsp20/alpha crystallin family protein [Pigmentiphaga sp. GD03639]|uniref:Hsp20/alpha crystallin family protein n=1 Tax=Pigmentiphaga daeguensis TaxID=414049 RepID=A0ABN1CP23_9BURK|nr:MULTISPECIES: Hsp20/alpha crystallin family protein [unclassified Pigmentiphaga]MDH2236525.1 Hsp20/alpha crystallin family protein [Pigmentiphaga sp. GD03639]OVZ61814.1 heat-shock protein Hsp20 [Pigmentiphaga sp. NML030171]